MSYSLIRAILDFHEALPYNQIVSIKEGGHHNVFYATNSDGLKYIIDIEFKIVKLVPKFSMDYFKDIDNLTKYSLK